MTRQRRRAASAVLAAIIGRRIREHAGYKGQDIKVFARIGDESNNPLVDDVFFCSKSKRRSVHVGITGDVDGSIVDIFHDAASPIGFRTESESIGSDSVIRAAYVGHVASTKLEKLAS